MLEDANRYMKTVQVEEQYQKPRFVRELRDVLGVNEGSMAHFEAQVEPVNDSSMRIDWFKDGKPITASEWTMMVFKLARWQGSSTGCRIPTRGCGRRRINDCILNRVVFLFYWTLFMTTQIRIPLLQVSTATCHFRVDVNLFLYLASTYEWEA